MDLRSLGAKAAASDGMNRAIVPNRVLQHDTDFTCYQCAAFEDNSITQAFNSVLNIVDKTRRQAGAEFVNSHLTMGLKGGRAEMATVKAYQEKRQKSHNPVLSARVTELRSMLAKHSTRTFKPVVNLLQEADDSLRQYQILRIAEHGVQASVIASGDKDLWFSEGIHMDEKTGRFYTVDGYGTTIYKDVGNVSLKLVGQGTSWFWHQMIMGDTADNIPGLPTISGRLANRYLPLKNHNPNRKPLACGEAKAVAILEGVTSELEAARRVLELYQDWYGMNGIEMLVEQAFLLWIRRTNKLTDVLAYLNSVGIPATFSTAQKSRLQKYIDDIAIARSRA